MPQPPKRWVAGKDAVDGIISKGHQLIADANTFLELSTSLDNND